MNKIVSNSVVFFALLATIFQQVIQGVDKAGRWQYAEFMTMADRLMSGQPMSNNVLQGDYVIQSIYFPGMAYLIAFIKTIFGSSDILTLYVIVFFLFLFLFISLFQLSIKFGNGKVNTFLSLVIIFSLFFDHFLFYLTEAKADPLLISLTIITTFIVHSILKNKAKKIDYFKLLLFLIFVGILKQQSIAIFAGLFIYLLLDNQFSKRIKLLLIGLIFFSGILVALIVLSNSNAYLVTIQVPSSHKFSSVIDNAEMVFLELQISWFYISVVIASIWINYKKIMSNSYVRMWLIISIFFLAMSIVSFLKQGGNGGNLQSGMVMFAPFFIMLIHDIAIKSSKFVLVLYAILLVSIPKNIMLSVDHYRDYLSNHQNNKSTQAYLKKNFQGYKALFSSQDYLMLVGAGLIPTENYDIYGQSRHLIDRSKFPIGQKIDIIFGDMKYINYDGFVEWKSNNIPQHLIGAIYVRDASLQNSN